jgi:hypothetical protein
LPQPRKNTHNATPIILVIRMYPRYSTLHMRQAA